MMDTFDFYRNQLAHLEQDGLLRRCVCIDSAQGPTVQMADGSKKTLFCSNNYLNLAEDQRICHAAIEAIQRYGLGASASRLICGTQRPHTELEQAFAAFLDKEAALYFPSGWMANQGVLTALPQKGDIVLLDKFDHASIIDAARACEAIFHTYRRNQLERLEKYLSEKNYKNRFIVTESVFSMDGDTANLAELVRLKKKYNAILIVDEAHSFGCFGSAGAGLCQQEGLLSDIDILIVPLGKAAGVSGAIAAGPETVIDYLINRARSFIYTTAPSCAIAAAALKALDIIQAEPERRKRLHNNAAYLRNQFQQLGLNIGQSTTHIIPVIIGDSRETAAVSRRLYEQGLFVSAIRPPTVPQNTARLRVSVQSAHTEKHLTELIQALEGII
ncbi:MAG: 8-amino-7-oxononanoate synthase [Phycisphaerae bacterium]|nr:8-amino-7-oxononanoate synthase [Phycisphaerae bacterium]